MSHAIRNLEHHHFKYPGFRRPGDVHVHFFGTATLSFSEGVQTQSGDVFEIEAAPFTMPVRNPIGAAAGFDTTVRTLRSEEHTSELQSLMRISYAVFCLKKKTKK